MIIVNQSKQNPSDIQPSEITSKTVFDNRRNFIKLTAGSSLLAGAGLLSLKAKAANISGGLTSGDAKLVDRANVSAQTIAALKKGVIYNPRKKIAGVKKSAYGKDLEIDTYNNITTYNNYYEFGTDK